MVHYRTVLIIGAIEILIGIVTFMVNIFSVMIGTNPKPLGVLFFVLLTACVSTSLGIGLLKYSKIAYILLLYFSSVIILTKFLIILDVIQLNGALETTIPGPIKNGISLLYHGFVIYYLSHPTKRKIFHL